MADKYFSIKSVIIIIIVFLIDEMSAFSICPTAIWSLSGTTVTGSTGIRLKTPIAIIVDNTSNIYAADITNYRVLQFPANSTTGILRINGSFGTGLNQFSS
ncbi:unnamed protein product, partial [Adineta steineri]